MQQRVLEQYDSSNLTVFSVWIPVLPTDSRESVDDARVSLPDQRVTHFWDDGQRLGLEYGQLLELPRSRALAWDIYLVFDPDQQWQDEPPAPVAWSHQLGLDDRHLGDGRSLAESIEGSLRGRP